MPMAAACIANSQKNLECYVKAKIKRMRVETDAGLAQQKRKRAKKEVAEGQRGIQQQQYMACGKHERKARPPTDLPTYNKPPLLANRVPGMYY